VIERNFQELPRRVGTKLGDECFFGIRIGIGIVAAPHKCVRDAVSPAAGVGKRLQQGPDRLRPQARRSPGSEGGIGQAVDQVRFRRRLYPAVPRGLRPFGKGRLPVDRDAAIDIDDLANALQRPTNGAPQSGVGASGTEVRGARPLRTIRSIG
jgi:hypothetical protein